MDTESAGSELIEDAQRRVEDRINKLLEIFDSGKTLLQEDVDFIKDITFLAFANNPAAGMLIIASSQDGTDLFSEAIKTAFIAGLARGREDNQLENLSI